MYHELVVAGKMFAALPAFEFPLFSQRMVARNVLEHADWLLKLLTAHRTRVCFVTRHMFGQICLMRVLFATDLALNIFGGV